MTVAAAAAIGIWAALAWTLWLLPFVAAGSFLVFAYNLELLGGRFHTDLWFALAWGAFPLLTAYVAAGGDGQPGGAARRRVRDARSAWRSGCSRPRSAHVRRRVARVTGELELRDGGREPITAATLAAAPEAALKALAAATVALALALLVLRLG